MIKLSEYNTGDRVWGMELPPVSEAPNLDIKEVSALCNLRPQEFIFLSPNKSGFEALLAHAETGVVSSWPPEKLFLDRPKAISSVQEEIREKITQLETALARNSKLLGEKEDGAEAGGHNTAADIQDLEKRLSHANGALEDIRTLATSCVGKDDPEQLHKFAQAILERILTSASSEWSEPGWYRHEWEEELWERYLSGDLKACATDAPSIEVSRSLFSKKGDPADLPRNQILEGMEKAEQEKASE